MQEKLTMEYYAEGEVVENIGAVVFLIVGVGIATLTLIFVGVLSGQVYQNVESDIDSISGSVINETFTALNGTAVSLANDYIVNGTLTIGYANQTENIGLGNFSIDYDAGAVTLTSGVEYNNTALNATYAHGQHGIESAIRESIISGFDALETTGSYLPIVVLAIIIFVVLSIVMGLGAFGGLGSGTRTGGAL